MQKRYTYPGKSKLQGSHAAEHPSNLAHGICVTEPARESPREAGISFPRDLDIVIKSSGNINELGERM